MITQDPCPCGADYAPEARFCGVCGAERRPSQCHGCGAECAGLNFCPMCGQALASEAPQAPEAPAQAGLLSGAVSIARVHLAAAVALVVVAMVALGVFRGGGGGQAAVAATGAQTAQHGDAAATPGDVAHGGDDLHDAAAGAQEKAHGAGEQHAEAAEEKAHGADEQHAEAAEEKAHGADEQHASTDDPHAAGEPDADAHGAGVRDTPAHGEVVAVAGDEIEGLHGERAAPAKAAPAKPRAKRSGVDRVSRKQWLKRPASSRMLTVLRWLEGQQHGPCDALPVTEVESEVTRHVRSHKGTLGDALRATCS